MFFYLLAPLIVLLYSCDINSNKHDDTIFESKSGKVIAIIDGDTYDILFDGITKKRIRMNGIDAPEKGMPFYKISKNYLGKLCFQKEVRLIDISIDKYGRLISRSFLSDGTDLSKEMIRSGLAWHYKEYSSDIELAKLEIQARSTKIGLWVDKNPMEPWLCRKLRRQGNHIEFSNDTILVQPTK